MHYFIFKNYNKKTIVIKFNKEEIEIGLLNIDVMGIGVSAILIMVFIIIYYILIKIFTVLFRIARISKTKSKFQVISLLTNSGYTTSESEIVVSNKHRRKIATACMIVGYAFSVIIISLIVNFLTHLNQT